MTADPPPDVRDRAARAANGVWIDRPNAEMLFEDWREIVDAVTAVVAPQIARPLQARVAVLEEANAAVEEENDLLRDVIQQKHARVEVLTDALTEITESVNDCTCDCYCVTDETVEKAEAALAAGPTESAPLPLNESGEVPLSYFSKPGDTESEDVLLDQLRSLDAQRAALLVRLREERPPWIFCTCGHSPHKHGDGSVPPALGSHCYAGEDVNDAYSNCSCKGYAPTESED